MWRVALLVLSIVACGGRSEPAGARAPVDRGPKRVFSYVALDGTVVDDARTRGRATVVLFFASYDAMSQMMARRLEELRRQMVPRINVLAIATEAPKYAPLVEAFQETLALGYPVALADRGTLSGEGPFGVVRGTPTLVVLDRAGREVWRGEGVTPVKVLEEWIEAASAGP
jgi:hypothetical protein